MNVIPAFEGQEAWECGAMSEPWPPSGKAPEGKWARIECRVRRGWFDRDPGCASGKMF